MVSLFQIVIKKFSHLIPITRSPASFHIFHQSVKRSIQFFLDHFYQNFTLGFSQILQRSLKFFFKLFIFSFDKLFPFSFIHCLGRFLYFPKYFNSFLSIRKNLGSIISILSISAIVLSIFKLFRL